MKTGLKLVGVVLVLVIVAGAAVYMTGNTMNVMVALLKPQHDFDLSRKAPAPDYANAANWAALPETEDLADLVPDGTASRTGPAPVDVFFIHPTGYLSGAEWNSPMDPDSRTEENTKWMLANQASAYNSCCNVYAPRYREASIFAYLAGDDNLRDQALDFAYTDVERAFNYFLANRNEGRPFIIASHSQGSYHGTTLLKKRIAGTPLREQMVAAFVIGGGTTREDLAEMSDIKACDHPDDLHCVVHWATFGDGGTPDNWREGTTVCTNPLSWANDGGRADASHHKGAVSPSGTFNIKVWGKDKAAGTQFGPLTSPLPRLTWAECRDGALFVADQSEGPLAAMANMPGKNYHGLDYPLFHMDIRENAVQRVSAYLQNPD